MDSYSLIWQIMCPHPSQVEQEYDNCTCDCGHVCNKTEFISQCHILHQAQRVFNNFIPLQTPEAGDFLSTSLMYFCSMVKGVCPEAEDILDLSRTLVTQSINGGLQRTLN